MNATANGGAEFRFDPFTRTWVAITATRQTRPNLPAGDCPFCVGGVEAPEPYVVKAFPNRWPALQPGEPREFSAGAGARVPVRGAAEVVLYSPDHNASLAKLGTDGAKAVVELWAERSSALLARPEVEYVLIFENRGAEVGATIPHPHGQIYAFPFVPPVAAREAEVAAAHGCQICEHAARVSADADGVVHQNETFVAFAHPAPAWPFEVIIAPVRHLLGLADLTSSGRTDLAEALCHVLSRYDRLFDQELPYMFWMHAGMHLHFHVVTPYRAPGTLRYVAAGELGSGVLFNPLAPETAAAMLRET